IPRIRIFDHVRGQAMGSARGVIQGMGDQGMTGLGQDGPGAEWHLWSKPARKPAARSALSVRPVLILTRRCGPDRRTAPLTQGGHSALPMLTYAMHAALQVSKNTP